MFPFFLLVSYFHIHVDWQKYLFKTLGVHIQISEISLLIFYMLNFTTANFIFVLLYLQLFLLTVAISGKQKKNT